MSRSITSRAVLLLGILLPSISWGAAVTFDASWSARATAATSGGAFSFTPSNSNNTSNATGVGSNSDRCLIAVMGVTAPQATMGTVTITWDAGGTNQTMTQIAAVDTGAFGAVYIFGLKSPATGNLHYVPTWTGGNTVDVSVGMISLYNCDQTTAWNNTGNDTGTGTSAASSVTSQSGDLVVVGHINQNATTTTINAGTGAYTETNMNGNYAAGYQASSGSSANVSWTLGTSVAWANAKINVCQSTGCGGGAGGSTSQTLMLMGVGK